MLQRCLSCAGSGKSLYMGGLTRTCPVCHGVGKVEEPEDEIAYIALPADNDEAEKMLKEVQASKPKSKGYDKRTISFKKAKEQLIAKGRTAEEAESMLAKVSELK